MTNQHASINYQLSIKLNVFRYIRFQIACNAEDYKFIDFSVSKSTAETLFATENPHYSRGEENGWRHYWDHRTRTILYEYTDVRRECSQITIGKLDDSDRLREQQVLWYPNYYFFN